MDPHQTAYEAVSSRLQEQFVWAEYISFYTIITNYNGPLASDVACINIITHITVARYGAILALKWTLISRGET